MTCLLKSILHVLLVRWSLSVHQLILKYWLLLFKGHWVGCVWDWLDLTGSRWRFIWEGWGSLGLVGVYWRWLVVRADWAWLCLIRAGAGWRWFCKVLTSNYYWLQNENLTNWMNFVHIARKLVSNSQLIWEVHQMSIKK